MIRFSSFKLLLLSSLLIGHVNAGEFWMDGVSRDSGWYDYNKTWTSYDSAGSHTGYDHELCWAASASNILSWWQDRLPDSIREQSSSPTGEAIYNTFRSSVYNERGNPFNAWRWWLNKETAGMNMYTGAQNKGGYYQGLLPDSLISSSSSSSLYLNDLWWTGYNDNIATFHERVRSAMEDGHCGLSLSISGDNLAHSLTLWGAVYDDVTQKLTSIFITDSDDTKGGDPSSHTLVELNCSYNEAANRIYLSEKGGTGTYADAYAHIGGVYALAALVPEPSSSLLLLAGSCFLLAGRRRSRTAGHRKS